VAKSRWLWVQSVNHAFALTLTIKPEDIKGVISGASGLLKPADESPNVPEEIAAFRKEFDDLLDKAGIEQLVVLIDDLDRCLPNTAIETLEAIRLFIFTSRTAFVVAADEAMIEYSVRRHFPDLPDTTGPQTYARRTESFGSLCLSDFGGD
jgi:predicted KAP-like P-loop ATPase